MFRKENHREGRKSGYIFTVKTHTKKGIMSVILGVISIFSIVAAIYLTYKNKGSAIPEYGAAVLLAMLFSLIGMVLGVVSRVEKDQYYFFPNLGIFLNFMGLAMVSMILYAGV